MAENTMKVKILRNTVADRRAVRAGDIEELSEHDARMLISIGKAEDVLAGDESPNVTAPAKSTAKPRKK